jgi:hypothetical protein
MIDTKLIFISRKLNELEPSLDFRGMDRTVLKMCQKDFSSFIEYLKETKLELKNRGVVIDNLSVDALTNLFNFRLLDDLDMQDVMDDRETIGAWTEWWFRKYKSRVKILLKDLPSLSSNANKADHLSKFTSEEITDIKKAIKFKFIESGEICGSTVLTEAIFMRVLNQYSEKFEWTISAKLHLLNAMLREANKLAHVTGTLIFIKPSKESYQLKEYRDDDNSALVKQ